VGGRLLGSIEIRPFDKISNGPRQSATAAEVSTEVQQGYETSKATPHGDASVTGTGVVLEGARTPNKATTTRNIVFITSEVSRR
jgi:hypothetical protein